MNNLVIFDLDGVLCNLKTVHFDSLNYALVKFGYPPIPMVDHLTRFDGLPTMKKLEMLGITGDEAKKVDELKQQETMIVLPKHVKPSPELATLLHKIIASGNLLAVVSNARIKTVEKCLELLSVSYLFAWTITPDGSQQSPKPSPEMFISLMKRANACPLTTVIFEDSPKGLQAAHLSGAKVVQVNGGLNHEEALAAVTADRQVYSYQWPELNVLIPAAGNGQRFKDAGYDVPKPFIDVHGKPMVIRVRENLAVDAKFKLVVRSWHLSYFYVDFWSGTTQSLAFPTSGTAETCLAESHSINNNNPLLIANSDQLLEWDHLAFYYYCQNTTLDGVIVTFDELNADHKWSYCEMNADGTVARVAEKEPISNVANCGVFFFRSGADFVKYAKLTIARDIRVKGEYYLASVIQLMIEDGKRFGTFKVDKFHSLGTPELLQKYLDGRKLRCE